MVVEVKLSRGKSVKNFTSNLKTLQKHGLSLNSIVTFIAGFCLFVSLI